jgi:hypothetical protein
MILSQSCDGSHFSHHVLTDSIDEDGCGAVVSHMIRVTVRQYALVESGTPVETDGVNGSVHGIQTTKLFWTPGRICLAFEERVEPMHSQEFDI